MISIDILDVKSATNSLTLAKIDDFVTDAMLLNGIARLTQHAGQSRLLLTLTLQSGSNIKAMIANIRTGLDYILSNAPQLPKADRWPALVRYIISKIIATRTQKTQFLDSPTFCLVSDSG